MSDDHSVTCSDEEDDSDNGYQAPEKRGVLSKWTNYIHGWQSRYIVMKDGTLSYYKSEQETGFGCRGAISLFKATIKPHEFDECRFDVSVNDCVWYLRAETPEEKQQWVDMLEAYKAESGYGSENSLKRHGSAISLTSNTLSTASSSSFKRGRGLKEKLAEMETFRGILCQQIESLQSYFDACAEASSKSASKPKTDKENILLNGESSSKCGPLLNEDVAAGDSSKASSNDSPRNQLATRALDFKGIALTFHATTAGVLTTLSHCLEIMEKREESWRRRLEREVEKRKKAEELYRLTRQHTAQVIQQRQRESHARRSLAHGGPDFEEGPHSALNDEEFYDAVESALDKIEEEAEFRERLKIKHQNVTSVSRASSHKLWPEIDLVSTEQLHYARLEVGEGVWELFAEDGEMRMYRREEEVNGMVIDPLKAVHTVKGVTGHEMCHYFFCPDVRHEWETTLEQMTILETISEDTLVFLQVFKRVWPASQRDALFWSHMRKVPDDNDADGHDIWIVCNHSTEHPDFPANSGKCVRVFLTVCLVCQTFIDPPKDGAEITRDNITCKITYCSVVNPGGWAPASVLRAVYKREYPKFLKKFTQYVIDQCKDKPILF
ncbi:ceramide transfer protein isoform X1 [Ischnura elegans]|uniref:ceramide transfer protein isoform X1 n=1 Tax=Ischnura elegans TaxID=197161 RepID=UPI001ED875B2|nr:ceramide transfer protein isoform X1 [Ischnura elegans]